MLTSEQELLLKKLYTEPASAASFSSSDALYREAKKHDVSITKKLVKQFLQTQLAYTLHGNVRHKFRRSPIIAYRIDSIWQADLADFSQFFRKNHGYRQLLIVIDVLSRFTFVKPLKNKSAEHVLNGMKEIMTENQRWPAELSTDAGTGNLYFEYTLF